MFKKWFGGKPKVEPAKLVAQASPPSITLAMSNASSITEKINRSGAKQAFRPNLPIDDPAFLLGRDLELEQAVDELSTPGRQILIYGDRGIGKSSLGIVTAYTLQLTEGFREHSFIRHKCTSQSTLASIFGEALLAAGYDVAISKEKHAFSDEYGAEVEGSGHVYVAKVKGKLDVTKKKDRETVRTPPSDLVKNPGWIAQVLKDQQIILFIDEMDTLNDLELKQTIGVFVRQASDDPKASLKVIMAGIGKTAADITGGHPSLQRNLCEIGLGTLAPEHIERIIDVGARQVFIETLEGARPLSFTPQIKGEIVKRSMGYPYFTNLICLEAARVAVRRADPIIDEEFELNLAVRAAVKSVSGDIKASFALAFKDGEFGFGARLLRVMVENTGSIITQDEWLEAYKETYEEPISNQKLAAVIRPFTKSEEEVRQMAVTEVKPILIRVRPGVFTFYDPRMPSFIRLALSGAGNEGPIDL